MFVPCESPKFLVTGAALLVLACGGSAFGQTMGHASVVTDLILHGYMAVCPDGQQIVQEARNFDEARFQENCAYGARFFWRCGQAQSTCASLQDCERALPACVCCVPNDDADAQHFVGLLLAVRPRTITHGAHPLCK